MPSLRMSVVKTPGWVFKHSICIVIGNNRPGSDSITEKGPPTRSSTSSIPLVVLSSVVAIPLEYKEDKKKARHVSSVWFVRYTVPIAPYRKH